mmetsp:Transcript_28968/g.39791  ORF Transcript_28968/g.39791 Transcript_28968/m.39791 type:complete len:198 (+) Transcript_28968:35-628(+)|eukprot:CAMPEP_0170074302 /NCGR_PEP_ID=MMETSP0019_2-20121128/11617_1 /TAXON_ID=98059 /ORGANISM="Dinobryon sp., Strain UTEXLB2267" /LENGTH=197 /DNA_ID=CAMNT_0010284491 /DNA_START=16 /DNA_END=609 /DNA_ORIENTATION=-
MMNLLRIAVRGPNETDHKRLYPNYHYTGEWKIVNISIDGFHTVDGINYYRIIVKSNDNKTWEVVRRYSDFTDLNFHLNQMEKHINSSVSSNDLTMPRPSVVSIDESVGSNNQSGDGGIVANGIFDTMQNPLPSKNLNTRNFHIVPLSAADLENRRIGLHNWLSEILLLSTSDVLGEVQQKRVQYELNWFLEAGDNLN